MPGFLNIREYAECFNSGAFHSTAIRKIPSQASTAFWWTDLSMASGFPIPNYYASEPLVAATLNGFRGVFHGDAKLPAYKYVSQIMLMASSANAAGVYRLLDYLLYYPFIDLDSDVPQDLDNTVALPRYETGAGVQAMMVCVAPTTGSGSFTFTYINQDGEEKTSPLQYCTTTAATIASLLTSQPGSVAGFGPFLKLSQGDTGIRRILNVTMSVINGGLGTIVLVKPLADAVIREINAPSESSFLIDRSGPPRILDGAYLNFICNAAASVAAVTISGRVDFVWK